MDRARTVYTCGHTDQDGELHVIRTRSVTRDNRNCIDNITCCTTCLVFYRKNNLIVDNEIQAERWLKRDK